MFHRGTTSIQIQPQELAETDILFKKIHEYTRHRESQSVSLLDRIHPKYMDFGLSTANPIPISECDHCVVSGTFGIPCPTRSDDKLIPIFNSLHYELLDSLAAGLIRAKGAPYDLTRAALQLGAKQRLKCFSAHIKMSRKSHEPASTLRTTDGTRITSDPGQSEVSVECFKTVFRRILATPNCLESNFIMGPTIWLIQ